MRVDLRLNSFLLRSLSSGQFLRTRAPCCRCLRSLLALGSFLAFSSLFALGSLFAFSSLRGLGGPRAFDSLLCRFRRCSRYQVTAAFRFPLFKRFLILIKLKLIK